MRKALVFLVLLKLGLIGIALGSLVLWIRKESRGYLVAGSYLSIALNVSAGWLLNKILRLSGPTFGSPGVPTSAVLGGVQAEGQLTWFGKLIVKMLDYLDEDHCAKEWQKHKSK